TQRRVAVGNQGRLVGVPVVSVAWRELEMPQQTPARAAQYHDGVRIQVVTLASARIEIRTRIAHAPIEHIRLRVVGTSQPRARPALAPRITGPGLAARLSRSRNGRESPALPAGGGIVGNYERTPVARRTSYPGHYQITIRERRPADISARIVPHLDFPQDFARGGR